MANIKRIQGLKNIHVAKLTGTNTYSTPVAILGAKEINLELSFEETKMYADDAIDYMDFIFAGGSGTLSMTGLTAAEYETLFGATVEGQEVTVSTNDVAPELAILFENDRLGTVGRRVYCIYAAKFAPPQISAKTKEGQVEDSQIDLQFVVRELSDGRVFKFKDTDTIDTAAWFASVPV